MPTIEEMIQWTPEQRSKHFMAKVCQALNITPDEVDMEYNDDELCVNLSFDEESYAAAYYHNASIGGRFEVYDFDSNDTYVEEGTYSKCMVRIRTAITHNRNARRVKELEAKVKWLEANTARILPQPIGEALMEAWH